VLKDFLKLQSLSTIWEAVVGIRKDKTNTDSLKFLQNDYLPRVKEIYENLKQLCEDYEKQRLRQ